MAEFDRQRQRLRRRLQKRGITDQRVLNAIGSVPRERFIAEELASQAYADSALPAAAEQTISQPFVVALMTQMLQLQGNEKVLEVGTGTGYQTAILAELAERVITIERIPELADAARKVLDSLDLTNIEFHTGDGTLGWPPSAPYDAILVTAGGPDVPAPLYNQLGIGGRLVIPVGDRQTQKLMLVVKGEGGPQVTDAGECRFVKLIGDAGWEDVTEEA